jgi:hypothetical protein
MTDSNNSRLLLGTATVLLLAIGFGGGYFVSGNGAPTNTSQQELTKRLVTAKAAIETGLTIAQLGVEETQLRTAAELADGHLSENAQKAVADAIYAIHQTRSAWQTTISTCHGDPISLDGTDTNCIYDLKQVFSSFGLTAEFNSLHNVKRERILSSLLKVCFAHIQTAIGRLS